MEVATSVVATSVVAIVTAAAVPIAAENAGTKPQKADQQAALKLEDLYSSTPLLLK